MLASISQDSAFKENECTRLFLTDKFCTSSSSHRDFPHNNRCNRYGKLCLQMGEKPKVPPFPAPSLSVTQIQISAGFLPSLPHSETTCSINTRSRQNRGNLTGQRERENDPGSVCASVCLCLRPCTYVQPEQSLLLYRCWISRKSAADETKHFLHGEGQRAKLDIEHLTGRQTYGRLLLTSLTLPRGLSIFFFHASYCTGEGYSLPEHFSELFELVVRHFRADGL